jgi:hypothetical protein
VKRDIVLGGVLLALLLIAALFSARPEAPGGATRSSEDYAFGGYHAWYDLEAHYGLAVQRFRLHHDELRGARIDTLIVAFPAPGVTSVWNAAEARGLEDWVRAGGRAVVLGGLPPVTRIGRRPAAVRLTSANRAGGMLRGPWSTRVATIPDRGAMRLRIAPRTRAQVLLRDDAGPLVVSYRSGRGTYYALADARPLENGALGAGDDARLAYLLAGPAHRGGVVAFDEAIRGEIIEKPWYRALTAPELLALALAAVAGLLWLLYGFVPLGPAVPLFAPREPTSEEFVEAVATLYARAGARAHARDALVAEAHRALERAPRTAENAALQARIDAAAQNDPREDAALVAVARLARLAREETIRATDPDRDRDAAARRVGRSRRRR